MYRGAATLQAGSLAVLHAQHTNLHMIEALEDSVFLDVIVNDYDHLDRLFSVYSSRVGSIEKLFVGTLRLTQPTSTSPCLACV